MTAKAKAPNYTDDQTATLVSAYILNPSEATVNEFAEKFGKTARSIVAKLVREKVYQKKEYVSKTGAPVEKKDDTADAIGALLGMTEAEVTSITKANKTALAKIHKALKTYAMADAMIEDIENEIAAEESASE